MTGDDAGADTEPAEHEDPKRHPASGASRPAMPQRPGTGQREPERREPGERHGQDPAVIPGEIIYGDGPVEINAGKPVTTLRVENTADRPVQVGSHYHFAEVNPGLSFDREAAWGLRLNVLSGGSVRFEPGAAEDVELVPIAGERIVAGLRGECGGRLDA